MIRNRFCAAVFALVLWLLGGGVPTLSAQTNILFPFNKVWKFQQNTNLNGVNWTAPAFDDAAWPAGGGVLAAENCNCLPQPIVTALTASSDRITYYFRTHFTFSGSKAGVSLVFSNLIDDGAVFYLNGVEIQRVNLPAAAIDYGTLALTSVSDATNYVVFSLAGNALTNLILGDNVLAVEVHQISTTSTDVVFGSALSSAALGGLGFDGVNDHVTFGAAPGLGVSNFTVECWFKRQGAGLTTDTGTAGLSAAIPLVSKGRGQADNSNVDCNFFLGINNGNNALAADFEDFNGGVNHPVIAVTAVTNNGWQHAAVTYDVNSGTWTLYLNGVPDVTNVIAGSLGTRTPRYDSIQHAGLATAMTSTGATAGFFNGVLDEVRIWNYARTAAQISGSYYLPITNSPPGLIARWALDDGGGATATNSIPGGVSGTLVNGPFWTTGYPFGEGAPNAAPDQPALLTPAAGSASDTNSPTLSVTVSDPEAGPLTVSFYGRLASTSTVPDFTLVALPDTQYYVSSLNGGSPDIFTNQTQWILANRTTRNIAYVAQLGDCVEHGDNANDPIEWWHATNALYRLENPIATQFPPHGVPYGVAVGNHDQSPNNNPDGTTTFYNQFFGETHFSPYDYYGGHYGANNDNHYDLFSAGGMDFIVIFFEFDAIMTTNSPVLAWASNLLATHSQRRGIVVSHYILTAGATFGPQGQAIYDALKSSPNLFLMLSGHVVPNGEARRPDLFNNSTVWSILSDYQDRPNGGNGWLRLYEFSPTNNVIHAKTWSPWLGQFETDANSQFEIPYAMTPTNPFTLIGTRTGIPSGGNATLTWFGLQTNTAYEWFVTVSDGSATTTGPLWRFTSGTNVGPVPLLPPTVSLTNPPNGSSFTTSNQITLGASASDPDGNVTNVAFYIGATKLGNDASSPYSLVWSNVSADNHTLTAVATDNDGLSATSAPITITITTPPPPTPFNFGFNKTWKYNQTANLDAVNWKAPGYDDSAWPSGAGVLAVETCGCLPQPIATTLAIGRLTYYFRTHFTYTGDPATAMTFSNLLDDGAVFYLNGVEVQRIGMPAGAVGYDTNANRTVSDATAYELFTLSGDALTNLVIGDNVLAVEVHQSGSGSSDIVFGSALRIQSGAVTANVTRGPYLQNGSHTNTVVRWRTDVATDTRVRYGTNVLSLDLSAASAPFDTEHEINLPGLFPDTKYFYSIGTASSVLGGGDTNHFFITAPLPGTPKNTRIWVLGDCGRANANQTAVRNAYYTFTGARHTDLTLMLGDNAYDSGTDAEFQAAVFNMYPTMLRKSVLWSTRGNHESATANGSVYYAIHTFPTNGSAGGMPSGTEAYYSFDYGNIHFICLDSEGTSLATNGAMAIWVASDIAATTADWIIAFWHHPPYTKGSHNSDDAGDSGARMQNMRQNFLPILEAAGVDLVLTGHSHCYERSFLLDGHYGLSTTITPAMKLDAGNGRTNGSGAYMKPAGGSKIGHKGAVYIVTGSAGETTGGSLNHSAMFISLNNLGSLVVDVVSNRLDARFVRETGAIDDYFTIIKSNSPPVATNLNFTLPADVSTNFTLQAADPNGNPLTFNTNSLPTRGLLSAFVPTNGAFTYTPAHGFTGVDSFTFLAHDGLTNSATATATLNVTALADTNSDAIPDAWAARFGVTDAAADDDADGISNWQEYFANTVPTNAGSVLKITSANVDGSGHTTLAWQSIGGTRYRVTYLNGDTNGGITSQPFTDIARPIAAEMDAAPVGTPSTQTFTDTLPVAPNAARYFRIKVVQ